MLYQTSFRLLGLLGIALTTTLVIATHSVRALEIPASSSYSYEPAPSNKQAIGTAYEKSGSASPLWFTLTGGIVTEIFYPSITQPQLGELQFVVTDGADFISEQRRDTVSQVRYRDEGMVVETEGRDTGGNYIFKQELFSDTAFPVLRIRTTFQWLRPGLRVFVVFKPTIHGTSEGNFGEAASEGLFAGAKAAPRKDPVFTAIQASLPWTRSSVEYEESYWDFWMKTSGELHPEAGPGSVILLGELQKTEGPSFTYELALAFGPSPTAAQTFAHAAMLVPFEAGAESYETGWKDYLRELNSGANKPRFIQGGLFARRSAQIIKMHEDKRHRGAIIPSLSGAPELRIRDAYHAAMGLLAAGDIMTPVDLLHYLMNTQREDGSWNREKMNAVLTGAPAGSSRNLRWLRGKLRRLTSPTLAFASTTTPLAMDEIAFPTLLAARLFRMGLISMTGGELEMVRKSVAYLLSHGPTTGLDRWETSGGFVPSTLAVEVAALRAASRLTGDPGLAVIADDWQSRMERWTLVQEGPLGKNYYLRSRLTEPSPSPEVEVNLPAPLVTQPAPGPLTSEEILDGGFLDLVRYGVRDPLDPRILNSLKLYDDPSLGISSGLHYHRYTLDTQGPGHQGGLWPVLAGERGIYAVRAHDTEKARAQLRAMESTANENGLLPEQFQAGSTFTRPFVWAHAEDLILQRSIEEGSVFDQPVGF